MECTKLEYMIFCLLVVQFIYVSLRISIEVLGVLGLREKLNAMLEYVYNRCCCCRPLPNRNNMNVQAGPVEADVNRAVRDVEAAQELQ